WRADGLALSNAGSAGQPVASMHEMGWALDLWLGELARQGRTDARRRKYFEVVVGLHGVTGTLRSRSLGQTTAAPTWMSTRAHDRPGAEPGTHGLQRPRPRSPSMSASSAASSPSAMTKAGSTTTRLIASNA